jgi:hypothetical protein
MVRCSSGPVDTSYHAFIVGNGPMERMRTRIGMWWRARRGIRFGVWRGEWNVVVID